MTQNYARPMPAMHSGMPVIPPRMQQQQQQELIQHHRRQQQMQMQQMQQTQQRQQMQGMNHARSVSSGSNRADPRPLNSKASSSSLASSGRRLRSESNPAHSSSHHQRNPSSGTSANQGLYINTSAFVVGHSRTNSNSDTSNSSSTSSYSPRSQSRAMTHSPSTATTTRSNTTGSSFQERMRERDREKQQRERDERDAAARAILDDPKLSATLLSQPTSTTTAAAAAAAQSTGTAIWNRLRAAKDVINATITGEERWPDSDDSDHEGESHVSRMLRDYVDKKEASEIAAKIAELEMTPVSSASSTPQSSSGSLSKSLSGRGVHRRPPDTTRYDNGTFNNNTLRSSPSVTSLRGDYYGQSLRARAETGYNPAFSEDGPRSAPTSASSRINNISNSNDTGNFISLGRSGSGRNGSTLTKSKSSGGPVGSGKLGNRFRTSSDASLSEALGRLEGKRNQDALVAQVSHLGSTRARSPHRGNRTHLDNVDEVPPPPLPTPKSSFRQHAQNSEQLLHSSPSRRAGAGALAASSNNNNHNADLGAYGQHLLQLQQKQ